MRALPLEEEYKKDTGITPVDIQVLREWLQTQPHLPGDRINDLELICTFYCCNNSFAVAKQLVDTFFTLKTHLTELFKDRQVDNRIENILNVVVHEMLPVRNKLGYSCFFSAMLDGDAKKYLFQDVVRSAIMTFDVWQYENGTCPGFILIMDLRLIVVSHIGQITLTTLQQFFCFLQKALLVKMKGIHFINAPPFMDKILLLFKPLVSKELWDMIYVHQIGSRTLDEYYPIEGLPKESGGNYLSVEEVRDKTLKKLREYKEFFVLDNLKRVDESRRPGKPKSVSDFFGGVEGSFKKLEID